jgi:hypothetical protein
MSPGLEQVSRPVAGGLGLDGVGRGLALAERWDPGSEPRIPASLRFAGAHREELERWLR